MTQGLCQLLFAIEFATRNSQGIMLGNQSNGVRRNGLTDGAKASSVQIGSEAMSWRGIENFYSNGYEFLDGCYNNNTPNGGNYFVCYDPTKFDASANHTSEASNYFKLSYAVSSSDHNGNIKSLGYDPNHLGAFFQLTHGGTHNQNWYNDDGDVGTSSGHPYARTGGDWGRGGYNGMYYALFGFTNTDKSSDLCSRLAYLPMA